MFVIFKKLEPAERTIYFEIAWLQRKAPVRLRLCLPREQSWGREVTCGDQEGQHVDVLWSRSPLCEMNMSTWWDPPARSLMTWSWMVWRKRVQGKGISIQPAPHWPMPFHRRLMPLSFWEDRQLQATRLDWGLAYWGSRTRGNKSWQAHGLSEGPGGNLVGHPEASPCCSAHWTWSGAGKRVKGQSILWCF